MFDKHVFFFILSKITISYKVRKNPALQDSTPAAGRANDIFRSAAVRSKAELFYFIGKQFPMK